MENKHNDYRIVRLHYIRPHGDAGCDLRGACCVPRGACADHYHPRDAHGIHYATVLHAHQVD